MDALINSRRPEGVSTCAIHCGTPQEDKPFYFTTVVQVRVWEDGSLAAFTESGAVQMFVRPNDYWSYQWQ